MKTLRPVSITIALFSIPVSATQSALAQRSEGGIHVHPVRSASQAGTTEIRVLPPEMLKEEDRFPVVYVLPVEARHEQRYGDGLLEVKRRDLHNRFRAIFVAPTFSQTPWYADHPDDPSIRQETYFLEDVVPFVEGHYHVRPGPEGRMLLGFSKSGWGAFSLLLRHPDLFGKAAAWDAPMMMERPGLAGSANIFGTLENFEKYQVTKLLERCAADLKSQERLILLGYGNFRAHHEKFHLLMADLQIPHIHKDGPQRKHHWEGGWVPEAVELLLAAPRSRDGGPMVKPARKEGAGLCSGCSGPAILLENPTRESLMDGQMPPPPETTPSACEPTDDPQRIARGDRKPTDAP